MHNANEIKVAYYGININWLELWWGKFGHMTTVFLNSMDDILTCHSRKNRVVGLLHNEHSGSLSHWHGLLGG